MRGSPADTFDGPDGQASAVRHGIARIDREIDDDLLELRQVHLHRPQIAAMHDLELDLFADQPPQQDGEIGQQLAEIEHLRAQRLPAREGQQLTHQRSGAIGILLDLHDVGEGRIGRLVGAEQEIRRHHDGRQHIVEVVRDAAGQLADGVHLLLLLDLVFQRPPLGIVERVDDRRFRIVVAIFVDRGDEEGRETLGSRRQRRLHRRDVALAVAGHGDRLFERAAFAFGDGRKDAAFALARALEHAGEQGIGAHDPSRPVDGRDRHRRIVEEAHEAHFGGALRILVLAARAVQHQRAGRSGRTVGAERHFVEQPDRNRAAAAGLEIEVQDFGLHLARHRRKRQKRSALARHDVGEFQTAGADFREILVEPARQRRVQIDDVARGIGGEEAGRRVIEIVDRVLQFLEDILLLFAVARDVRHAPDRGAGLAPLAVRRAAPAAAASVPARRARR